MSIEVDAPSKTVVLDLAYASYYCYNSSHTVCSVR